MTNIHALIITNRHLDEFPWSEYMQSRNSLSAFSMSACSGGQADNPATYHLHKKHINNWISRFQLYVFFDEFNTTYLTELVNDHALDISKGNVKLIYLKPDNTFTDIIVKLMGFISITDHELYMGRTFDSVNELIFGENEKATLNLANGVHIEHTCDLHLLPENQHHFERLERHLPWRWISTSTP